MKINPLKRRITFQIIIFGGFHVSFRVCKFVKIESKPSGFLEPHGFSPVTSEALKTAVFRLGFPFQNVTFQEPFLFNSASLKPDFRSRLSYQTLISPWSLTSHTWTFPFWIFQLRHETAGDFTLKLRGGDKSSFRESGSFSNKSWLSSGIQPKQVILNSSWL